MWKDETPVRQSFFKTTRKPVCVALLSPSLSHPPPLEPGYKPMPLVAILDLKSLCIIKILGVHTLPKVLNFCRSMQMPEMYNLQLAANLNLSNIFAHAQIFDKPHRVLNPKQHSSLRSPMPPPICLSKQSNTLALSIQRKRLRRFITNFRQRRI